MVGVDAKPQRRYPFPPPCQFGTEMRFAKNAKGSAGHLNLIPQTRELLRRTGKPYVIENVRAVRPHLVAPVSLRGQMFDLHMVTSAGQRFDLDRERLFETNWPLMQPWNPGRANPVANVFDAHLRNRSARHGGRQTRDFVGRISPPWPGA